MNAIRPRPSKSTTWHDGDLWLCPCSGIVGIVKRGVSALADSRGYPSGYVLRTGDLLDGVSKTWSIGETVYTPSVVERLYWEDLTPTEQQQILAWRLEGRL